MSEYVVNPELAHGAVRDAETRAEDGQRLIPGLAGSMGRVAGHLSKSRVGPALQEWYSSNVAPNLKIASVRVDNAAGAAHQVIDALEAADIETSASIDRQHLATSATEINKALSR